jgi:hypothetical protein
MKKTWTERLNVTKTPNKNLAFRCANLNKTRKIWKNKSIYLPPKVTTPKYFLKWRWSAFNRTENSKDYIWQWPMKFKMTCINNLMNSKRKQIKRLKLKAQSWRRSPCLLLTGVLRILLSMVAATYCECLRVPRRQTWTWGFWCVTDHDALFVQVSCHTCSFRSQHQTWWSIQRPCLSPVLSTWQVITAGPWFASTSQRG